jgi:hypothetical protein
VKSPTMPCTCTPGYAEATAATVSASALADTSSGVNAARLPCPCSPSSSSRVLSEAPEPSSISVFAPVTAAISPHRSASTARSARVG